MLHSFRFHGSIFLKSERRNEISRGNDKGTYISLWFYTFMKTAPDLIGLIPQVDTGFYSGNNFFQSSSNKIQLTKYDIREVLLLAYSYRPGRQKKTDLLIIVLDFSTQLYSNSKNYMPKCILTKVVIIWR